MQPVNRSFLWGHQVNGHAWFPPAHNVVNQTTAGTRMLELALAQPNKNGLYAICVPKWQKQKQNWLHACGGADAAFGGI
jgi:hypothetical protein